MLKKSAQSPLKTMKINKNVEKPLNPIKKGRKTLKNPIKNLNNIKNF